MTTQFSCQIVLNVVHCSSRSISGFVPTKADVCGIFYPHAPAAVSNNFPSITRRIADISSPDVSASWPQPSVVGLKFSGRCSLNFSGLTCRGKDEAYVGRRVFTSSENVKADDAEVEANEQMMKNASWVGGGKFSQWQMEEQLAPLSLLRGWIFLYRSGVRARTRAEPPPVTRRHLPGTWPSKGPVPASLMAGEREKREASDAIWLRLWSTRRSVGVRLFH